VVTLTSERTTLALSFLCYATAHSLFAASAMTPLLILAAVFAGLGFGLSIPLLNHATVENSTEHNRGRNLSLFAVAVFAGQFVTSVLEFIPLPRGATLYACALLAVICAVSVGVKRPQGARA
jgi:MFS family permease